MEEKATMKCEKCECNLFEIDAVRSGYELPEMEAPFNINDTTKLIWKTYFKCSGCEWEIPYPKIGLPEEPITITFYVEKKEQ